MLFLTTFFPLLYISAINSEMDKFGIHECTDKQVHTSQTQTKLTINLQKRKEKKKKKRKKEKKKKREKKTKKKNTRFVEALIFMYLKQNEAQSARAESTDKGVN